MRKFLFVIAVFFFIFYCIAMPQAETATLTYDNIGSGDHDWANELNWTTGEVAGALDDALITDDVSFISAGVASVYSADFSNGAIWDPDWNGLTLSVVTSVTFNDTSHANGAINGNATFNDTSYSYGTITGDVTFNDTSYNNGTITGDATFNTTHYDATVPTGGVFRISGGNNWNGSVSGTVRGADHNPITSYEFYGSSCNYGTITGDVTFNTSSNYGTITGDVTFNNASSNDVTITGNATFNDASINYGTITGDTTFNDTSRNYGILNGNITFNTTSNIIGTINGGTVSGDFKTSGIAINSGTVSSHISGAGVFTKEGTGTVTLNGASTYSGGTTITGGTLAIGNANALGTGAVTNNATLDIGSTALNIGGAYTQGGASTLMVTVNGTSNGSIVAAGVATVSATGNLVLNVTNYIPNNSTYTIITGHTGGSIAAPTITDNSAVLTFAATTIGDDLGLTVTRANTYNEIADASNASAAGLQLEAAGAAGATGDMLTILNALDGRLSASQINAALDTMVPTVDAGVLNNSIASLNNFLGASLDRAQNVLTLAADSNSAQTDISSGDQSKLSGIWVKEYGSYIDQGTRKGVAGYHAWNAGTAIGWDRLFNDTLTLGISGGYAYGKVNSAVNDAKTNITSTQGTVYVGYQDANIPYFIDAAGSFAWNWYAGKRDISIGAIDRTANSDYDGQQYGFYLGGGYNFKLGNNLELAPLASIQWNHLCLAGYTETEAGSMNLSVNRQSYDMLQSGLGARVTSVLKHKWGNLTPELHLKWLYDFIGDSMAVTSTYTGGGGSFTSNGAKPAKSSLNLGGKLSFDLKKDISLTAECDTELKNEFFGVYGSAAVRYRF